MVCWTGNSRDKKHDEGDIEINCRPLGRGVKDLSSL